MGRYMIDEEPEFFGSMPITSSCTCRSWHEEPCSYCLGDTECEGGCGQDNNNCECGADDE